MRRLVALFGVMGMLTVTAGRARAQATQDNRLWVSAAAEAELTERLRADLEQELRLGTEAGFVETYTQLGLRVKVLAYLHLGAAYRYIAFDGETRHRGLGDVLVPVDLGKVALQYRVRFQGTTREQDDTQYTVRNRLKLEVNAPKKLTPFLGAEIFYQVSPNAEYRERRIFVGVAWQALKKLELAAYYLNQHEANVSMPEANHVLVLEVAYRLREVAGRNGGE